MQKEDHVDTRSINNMLVKPQSINENATILPSNMIDMKKQYPTSFFEQFIDYQENMISPNDKAVYFGSRYHLRKYYDDLTTYQQKSAYFGRVFYPENRMWRNEKWSYAKNMAFWASIIDRNQPLVLLTDIAYYPKKGKKLTGTISEILWLVDNGYELSVNLTNPVETAFVPPVIQKNRNERILINYFTRNKNETLNYFNEIKQKFLMKKSKNYLMLNTDTINYPQKNQAPQSSMVYRTLQTNIDLQEKTRSYCYDAQTTFITRSSPENIISDDTDNADSKQIKQSLLDNDGYQDSRRDVIITTQLSPVKLETPRYGIAQKKPRTVNHPQSSFTSRLFMGSINDDDNDSDNSSESSMDNSTVIETQSPVHEPLLFTFKINIEKYNRIKNNKSKKITNSL